MPKSNATVCHICGKDLATCDTIWAAEGRLYCSPYCGASKYTEAVCEDDVRYAYELFYSVAEEINPKDIGLEVQNEQD